MTERAREAAARALLGWAGLEEGNERGIVNVAIDAYIAALAETHAIVPREPTEAMTDIWTGLDWTLVDSDGDQIPGEAERIVKDVYRAMLNAAGEK